MSEEGYTERLSVAEAAEVLGVTRDAIHKRIRRGTIRYEQGEDGRFYVYVDTSMLSLDTSADVSKDESKVEVLERLVDSQQDRIAFLEQELERRGDESERLHRIVAGLTQVNSQLSSRLPELEAGVPPETPSAIEKAAQGPEWAEEAGPSAAGARSGGAAENRSSGGRGRYIRVVLLIVFIFLLWMTSLLVGLYLLNA